MRAPLWRIWALFLALIAASHTPGSASGAGTQSRPNIVIILADDLGCGSLGCYGGAPDQFVIQSWVGAPSRSLPETGEWTFTRSVRDFVMKFVKTHWAF